MAPELRVPVAEILGRPGARRHVRTFSSLDLAVVESRVDGDVTVDLTIEAILGGLSVTGEVRAPYAASCRRCLEPVRGEVAVEVLELFEDDPTEGETYPIEGDHIDLEPLVREAVLLALPLAPLCGDECAGPDPQRYPTGPAGDPGARRDPRWAALDELLAGEEDDEEEG